MTREQKLEEALKLAAQSAGFQYMTAETRNKIDTALSDAATAPLPHDAIGVVGTLIESLEEGLMTDAGLSGRDRAAMRHQIEALTMVKDGIAALSAPKAEAVTVKALEWEPYPSDGSLLSEGQNQKRNYVERALTPWGSAIFLMEKDGLYSLRGANDLEARSYDSQEAAKSSAFFEFFAPCILSAVAPVPAITDEMVERTAKAIHDGPLGANDEEDFGDNKASDWCREVARAALLAAFPGKGEGE